MNFIRENYLLIITTILETAGIVLLFMFIKDKIDERIERIEFAERQREIVNDFLEQCKF